MSVKLTVTYAGTGTVPGLRLKDEHGTFHRLTLASGKASLTVSGGVSLYLFWAVVGPAGAQYKITMTAPPEWTVQAARNPITRNLPPGEFSWGRVRLNIVKTQDGGAQ